MADRWSDVDALMRRLGALRAAITATPAAARDEAEQAMARAAEAIEALIDAREDRKALAAAREALITAEELIAKPRHART